MEVNASSTITEREEELPSTEPSTDRRTYARSSFRGYVNKGFEMREYSSRTHAFNSKKKNDIEDNDINSFDDNDIKDFEDSYVNNFEFNHTNDLGNNSNTRSSHEDNNSITHRFNVIPGTNDSHSETVSPCIKTDF